MFTATPDCPIKRLFLALIIHIQNSRLKNTPVLVPKSQFLLLFVFLTILAFRAYVP
jgi:hypothetical protein